MKYIITESQKDKLVRDFLELTFEGVKTVRPSRANKKYIQFWDKSGDMIMDGIIDQELLVQGNLWFQLHEVLGLDKHQINFYLERFMEDKYGYSFDSNIIED